jgi:signal transduction histidine kinase
MELHVESSTDSRVETDPELVGQILFNLVDNGCKYARSAQTPGITIAVRSTARQVEIEVRDDGPGIDPDEAARLFEPFHRAGREATNIPGIGLGLSLSRELARSLGGDLLYAASPGGGSVFTLTLPVG